VVRRPRAQKQSEEQAQGGKLLGPHLTPPANKWRHELKVRANPADLDFQREEDLEERVFRGQTHLSQVRNKTLVEFEWEVNDKIGQKGRFAR
jgi:hypothetical protein